MFTKSEKLVDDGLNLDFMVNDGHITPNIASVDQRMLLVNTLVK